MRHSEAKNIFLPFFFTMTHLRTLRSASTMRPPTDVRCLLQSPSGCNGDAPYSAAGGHGRGAGHPASWGTLVCRSHYNPSILHPECRQQLLLPHASHKRYKVCRVHCPLDELFAPSGWERDVRPHPEAANCLRGATRKSPHYSKVLSFSLQILVIALYLK